MDFSLIAYQQLLHALIKAEYRFQTFAEFLQHPLPRCIILRHDVDLMPANSLRFAHLQHQLGIQGVYYFRAVPESWDESIIRTIAALGHEIGYHYECLTTCRGNMAAGIIDFERNLTALRALASVQTICMHGSPLSPYDSKDLWKVYDYKSYGILGEPYFDVNFNQVFYLTDTGRRWDGDQVSVRDKVKSGFALRFHSTDEIIRAVGNKELPDRIMFTFHPQRWNDNLYYWCRELLLQTVKNLVKKYYYVR
ncbi:hypothetical protein GCM10023187_13120 [Nibrella viscosa]|uniref:Polysaccharide deacetylase n=2 Tax=Nibrella viscosa TaxID=1084524 RepID=A0ABP8K562_9BACT